MSRGGGGSTSPSRSSSPGRRSRRRDRDDDEKGSGSRDGSPAARSPSSAFLKREAQGARRQQSLGDSSGAVKAAPFNETKVAKARREREEQAKKDAIYALVMARYRARTEEKRHEDALRARARRLQGRLLARPADLRSLRLLTEVCYEMGDHLGATIIINKALKFDDLCSFRLYIMLARSYVRIWFVDHAPAELQKALEAYRNYMRDPEIHRAGVASAVPYLELSGILLRMGRHQSALDTLGALMTSERWQQSPNWMSVTQYAVAQIYLLLGMLPEALKIYQRLMMCPLVVEAPLEGHDKDHCMMLSTRLVSVLLSVEMARLQQRMGNGKLAILLLKETFQRQERYRYSPDQTQLGGDVDIRFGHTKWDEWISDPGTFRQLALLFRKEGNVPMAIEMFGVAGEVQGRVLEQRTRQLTLEAAQDEKDNGLTQAQRAYNRQMRDLEKLTMTNAMLQSVLDRAELLAELHLFDDASFCCDYAMETRPHDLVVLGRAAKSCLRGAPDAETALAWAREGKLELPEKSAHILRESRRIMKAVSMVARVLRVKVARRRREARLQLNVYATMIQSAIRMCTARNRTAEGRLAVVATIRIGHLVRKLRYVWRTGRAALDMYTELWSLSVTPIQRIVVRFLHRRRRRRLARGIVRLQRVYRGQSTRRLLRTVVDVVQRDLETGCLRDPVIKKGGRIVYPYYPLVGLDKSRLVGKERLSAGVNVLTDDQNLPVVAGRTIGEYSLALKPRYTRTKPPAEVLLPPAGTGRSSPLFSHSHSHSHSHSIGDELASASVHSHSSAAAATTWFVLPAAPASPSRHVDSKFVTDTHGSTASPTSANKGLSPGTASFIKSAGVSTEYRASASFCSQEELQVHVAASVLKGEDVPCLLHIRSVLDDATLRWVPFGLLSDTAIKRLLTCTALMLTSQSLRPTDVARLCYVVKKLEREKWANLGEEKSGGGRYASRESKGDGEGGSESDGEGWPGWQSVRSLFIQGTRIGQGGVSRLLALGLGHMHTLSLGAVGLTPAFGHTLGACLTDLLDRSRGGAGARSCLTKLYIEQESRFGDEGAISLVRALQFNSTIRVLALRDCHLSHPSVESIGRYLTLSTALEVLHLGDNHFRLSDARCLVRAVANKGLRGCFRALHLEGLSLQQEQLQDVHRESLLLGVRVVAPEVSFRAELRAELDMKESQEDFEERSRRNVANAMQERLRRGGEQLDPNRKEVPNKEVFF